MIANEKNSPVFRHMIDVDEAQVSIHPAQASSRDPVGKTPEPRPTVRISKPVEGLALVVHGCSPLRGWLGREESVRGSREGMTGKDGLGEGKKLRGALDRLFTQY